MKQVLALITIVLLPCLISCDQVNTSDNGQVRGLSSRTLLERIASNYNKIKSAKANDDDDTFVKEGVRLFIDMGEPWSYFILRGLLPGNNKKMIFFLKKI